jgi:hypothetical protein
VRAYEISGGHPEQRLASTLAAGRRANLLRVSASVSALPLEAGGLRAVWFELREQPLDYYFIIARERLDFHSCAFHRYAWLCFMK